MKTYNGKHWMQQPENRAKMMKMVNKMKKGQMLARRALKNKPKIIKKERATSVVINGWKVTLSKNEIRIDKDE